MATIEVKAGQVWQGINSKTLKTITKVDLIRSDVWFTSGDNGTLIRYPISSWIEDHKLIAPVVDPKNQPMPAKEEKPKIIQIPQDLREAIEQLPQNKRARLDVMIDIEALSTAPNGALIEISAVPFDIGATVDTHNLGVFSKLIAPKSCVEAGLDVNSDTMKWWFSQDENVQYKVLAKSISDGGQLKDVLNALTTFLNGLTEYADAVFIWGYPATSDMTWLQQAYRAVDLPYPIAYNRTRCLATVADLYWERTGEKLSQQAKTKINHESLIDCKAQIEMICLAHKELT